MLTITVAGIGVLVVCAYVGDALTTTWADENPLALIALNSRTRILVLTTNQLDPVSYYLVASLRLLVSDPLFFLLGVWYGDSAIRWVERKSPTYGELFRNAEGWFGTAAYPLVVIMPNNWICLLAGAAGMSIPAFFVLNLVGTVGRLYLIRVLGATFESSIDDVLGFFRDYRLELFLASVALVGIFVLFEFRRGKGDIGAVRDLEHELEEREFDRELGE